MTNMRPGGFAHLPAFLPLLATMAAMACFQFGAATAKFLFPTVGPLGTATLRLSLAAIVLLAWVRPWRRWPAEAPLPAVLGLGVSVAGAIVCFYLAIERLPLGVALPIQFLGPLVLAIVTSRRARDLAWTALAGIGVWCLVASPEAAATSNPIGILFALGAAVSWASYIVCGRAAGSNFGGGIAAAVSVSAAALLVLPIGIYQAGAALLSPALLPLALVVALGSAVIPFSLELYAMPRLPARTFATFTSLEPGFAVMAGFFFLGETLRPVQLAGVLMVIGASAGSAWSNVRARRSET